MTYIKGSHLVPDDKKEALNSFVHRFTKDHKPVWAVGRVYKVQFESDNDWLEHTKFAVRGDFRLDKRFKHCQSKPTWPDNPELRNMII